MDFNNFISEMIDCIKSQLGEDYTVVHQEVLKNNSKKLHGIVVKKLGQKIAPTIYMEDFYDRYINGDSMKYLAGLIVDISNSNCLDGQVDMSDFYEFENIKTKIMYKLVNTAQNEEMLAQVPHREILDLSVVYYCYLSEFDGAKATVTIRNEHISRWQVGEDELYEIALANMNIALPGRIIRIEEALKDLLDEDMPTEGYPVKIFVATNEDKFHGAPVIFYNDAARLFAEKYGDFYVLPSSIHETLLVPECDEVDPRQLQNMVIDVNRSDVSEEEYLSDCIYHYSASDDNFSLINYINELC